MKRVMWSLMVASAALGMGACTHVRGVVVDEGTERPHPTAVFTVGRPDGIAIYQRNPVERNGRFDFYISPTDESTLYVFDSSWGAAATMRRIDRTEISDHMHVVMPRANPATGDEYIPLP